ncbi:MAG: hypothetical protein KatS3mg131_0165 [Candidatus Tectimicrobiota bacterium]|nr:MAG: hypothetical protein KatS3mg131_0165 [Candidatus Tectomicrobia bacterium]
MPAAPPAKPAPRASWWYRLGTHPAAALAGRLLVGAVFIVAGGSKLLLPPEEVEALLRQYPLPAAALPFIARLLPWLELLSGTALFIGFYTTAAAALVAVQLAAFSLLMGVVLVQGIPIADCGCFGHLGVRETPAQVLVRDVVLLALLGPVLWRRGDLLAVDAWHAAGDTHDGTPLA